MSRVRRLLCQGMALRTFTQLRQIFFFKNGRIIVAFLHRYLSQTLLRGTVGSRGPSLCQHVNWFKVKFGLWLFKVSGGGAVEKALKRVEHSKILNEDFRLLSHSSEQCSLESLFKREDLIILIKEFSTMESLNSYPLPVRVKLGAFALKNWIS